MQKLKRHRMPKIQDPRKLKSAFLKWMMIFKRRHHILVIDSMVSSTSKLVRLGEACKDGLYHNI
uniref:Uncharacterized protein n=1 Tax=Wuchereria bancrofti TaxID=6293 RepID=A0AAF5RT54_WUCBA